MNQLKQHIVSTSTDGFELKYFKTVTQGEDDGVSFYGIFVEKHVNGSLAEDAASGSISESNSQVCEIINKLAENSVTPFLLCEILDEII